MSSHCAGSMLSSMGAMVGMVWLETFASGLVCPVMAWAGWACVVGVIVVIGGGACVGLLPECPPTLLLPSRAWSRSRRPPWSPAVADPHAGYTQTCFTTATGPGRVWRPLPTAFLLKARPRLHWSPELCSKSFARQAALSGCVEWARHTRRWLLACLLASSGILPLLLSTWAGGA